MTRRLLVTAGVVVALLVGGPAPPASAHWFGCTHGCLTTTTQGAHKCVTSHFLWWNRHVTTCYRYVP